MTMLRPSRRSIRSSVLLALIVTGALSCQLSAQDSTAVRIARYMQALTALDGFTGSVLVAREGHVIHQGGYGLANTEWNIPNTPDTRFRIGSLTKQFTAMAILILQDRGKLHLADPVCRYIAGCPTAWRPITIQELLTHTSGIPDYTELPGFARTQMVPTSPQELIRRVRHLPLHFAPGSRFEYSNTGFVLLGIAIERASGMPYESFLQGEIVGPLRLANTGVDHPAMILSRRAAGYVKEHGAIENAPPIDPSVAYAAGAMYSTVGDLMIWDEALYTDRLVSRAARDDMFTPHAGVVGYGWVIGSQFGRRMAHHNGEISGFVSNIARFPDQHLVIILLSNRDGTQVDKITQDLAAIVFGEPYEMPHPRTIVTLGQGALDRYVGTYRVTADIRLMLRRSGDHLTGRLSGGDTTTFTLSAESRMHFFSDTPPVDLVFALDSAGRAVSVTINGAFTGTRLP